MNSRAATLATERRARTTTSPIRHEHDERGREWRATHPIKPFTRAARVLLVPMLALGIIVGATQVATHSAEETQLAFAVRLVCSTSSAGVKVCWTIGDGRDRIVSTPPSRGQN